MGYNLSSSSSSRIASSYSSDVSQVRWMSFLRCSYSIHGFSSWVIARSPCNKRMHQGRRSAHRDGKAGFEQAPASFSLVRVHSSLPWIGSVPVVLKPRRVRTGTLSLHILRRLSTILAWSRPGPGGTVLCDYFCHWVWFCPWCCPWDWDCPCT